MKRERGKIFADCVLFCSLIVACALTTFAQRPTTPSSPTNRLNLPGREINKEQRPARAQMRLLSVTIEEFETQVRSSYPNAERSLTTTIPALKTRFEAIKADNPNLGLDQFMAAETLVKSSREVRSDINITDTDILNNWKDCVKPKQLLRNRGFTADEAKLALDKARKRLADAKQ